MNNKSKSPYGTSFLIRVGVLLALLLFVGGAMAYDRLILVPTGEEAVKKILSASKVPQTDRSAIHTAAGRGPNKSETVGSYEVEHWEFGRILPNLEGHKVSVAFEKDGRLTEVYAGGLKDDQREMLSMIQTKQTEK